jgi:signal transduction histidine kinase
VQLKLTHKLLIIVFVPLTFELAFVFVLSDLLHKAEVELNRETHSKAVIAESNELVKNIYDTSSALVAYAVSPSQQVTAEYLKRVELIPARLRSLELLVSGSHRQKAAFDEVYSATNKALSLLKNIKNDLDAGENARNLASAGFLRKRVTASVGALIQHIHELIAEERQIEEIAPQQQARFRDLIVSCLVGGLVLNVLLAVAMALFISQSTVNRLRVLMDNTRRMVGRQELNPAVGGTDEIAHLDSTFHDMARELALAEKQKQEVISMVSHDLRSPLMSLDFSLTLIGSGKYGELNEKGLKELSSAEISAKRLIRLINDLLDIEKIESGKLNVLKMPLSFHTLAEHSVDAVRALAVSKEIELVIEGSDDIEFPGDSDRLEQVIINLLGNAIKFSPNNSKVFIRGEEKNSFVEIRVIDSGPGIPAEYKKRIFERFQQVSRGDGKEKEGTGLGLAISRAIVEAHGGTIGVESENGKGSSFWIRLPDA